MPAKIYNCHLCMSATLYLPAQVKKAANSYSGAATYLNLVNWPGFGQAEPVWPLGNTAGD